MICEALTDFLRSRFGARQLADAALLPGGGAGERRGRHPLRSQFLLLVVRELAPSALKNPFGIRADRVSCDTGCPAILTAFARYCIRITATPQDRFPPSASVSHQRWTLPGGNRERPLRPHSGRPAR